MYFIYLIVFVLMVFTPIFVWRGTPLIGEEEFESLLILFLGSIGFILFWWREKQFKLNFSKRISAQRESHRIFKDLSEAYSYIGEVNRKLEIMKDVALSISENLHKKGRAAYEPFFGAFTLLGKSKKIDFRFINIATFETLGEIRADKKIHFHLDNKALVEKKENFSETEKYFIIKSPRDIDGIISVVIIHRHVPNHKIDDPEIVKGLASQLLRFFILSGKCL